MATLNYMGSNNMKKKIITPQGIQELDLTSEEINQREQDAIDAEQRKIAIEQAEADKQTKKASGKQKLLDLGLTEEEVKALIGV